MSDLEIMTAAALIRRTPILPAWRIVREGFAFYSVGPGFRSPGFTSASQAGLVIARKAGREAYVQAVDEFSRTKGVY